MLTKFANGFDISGEAVPTIHSIFPLGPVHASNLSKILKLFCLTES